MGRLTPLLVLTFFTAVTLMALSSCGRSSKPKKKESKPPVKTERVRPKPGKSGTTGMTEPGEAKKPKRIEDLSPEAMVAAYVEMLSSKKTSKRKEALNRLMTLKDEDLDAPVFKAIRERLTDRSPDVRGLAGIALLKLKGKEGSPLIHPLLKDPSEEVRACVLDELGKLGKEFSDELMNGLKDPSPAIQEIVLDHLSRQKNRRADGLAVQIYGETENERLRAQILSYLIKIKSPKGAAAVAAHIEDLEYPTALTLAVRYLGEFGNSLQARQCIDFLNDREIGVRKEAVRIMALRKIKTLDSISCLIHLLKDEEFEVRKAALKSLKALTNQAFDFDPMEEDEKKLEAGLKKWETWLEKNAKKLPEK